MNDPINSIHRVHEKEEIEIKCIDDDLQYTATNETISSEWKSENKKYRFQNENKT